MADLGPVHGWSDPTATTGTSGWTTPDNVFASDDADAVYTGSAQDYLQIEGFGFAIPDNCIITGIEVSVEARSATSRTIEVALTKNGTAITGSAKTQALTGTETIYRLGGATDTWSATDGLSVAEINAATFGVFLRDDTATASDIEIDHVIVRVFIAGGIRARFDVDFDEKQVSHIDVIVDYDGGASGTAPTDAEVIYNTTATGGGVGRIVRAAPASGVVFGSLQLAETHDGDGDIAPTWADADSLEVCSYVDFNTEVNGGLDETDIGSAFTVTGGTGTRTGVIRHIESNGTDGRMWWDPTGEGGTAFTGDETIQIGGTSVADANGAEVANAWTGVVNTAGFVPTQGYVSYDAESVKMEASSGLERIRDISFQHNLCIYGQTSGTTAMLVHDFEDPNDALVGRFYLADIIGSGFTDGETIIALFEQDWDTETADWDTGDVVGDAASPTDSFTIRRLIDNGDLTGTMYMQRLAGSGFFADDQAMWLSGGSQQSTANGATRERVGSVTADGAQVTTDVQWRMNHLYSDLQRQMAAITGLQMDDLAPMTSSVQDGQYTSKNTWELRHFSTRRVRGGALFQHDAQGGADIDDGYTNDAHLGSLNTSNGVNQIYVAQDISATDEEVIETFWDAGPHDILVRNKLKNAKIDGGTRRHLARNWGDFYDWFKLSKIGGAQAIPLNSANDGNNNTVYATVRDDASKLYHRIIVAWASHTIDFDTGTGALPVAGDVVFNETDLTAGILCASPASLVSGVDLHIGTHGQDITGWGDGEVLNLLDYADFDAQVSQFTIGQAVEDSADDFNGTVRFVQQFGGTRCRVWFSGVTGTLADDETVEPDGGAGSVIATCDGGLVTAGTWQALTNGATPETVDQTVLLDTGAGGTNPYRAHAVMNSATVAQLYEFLKFITEERAGDPAVDPGSILYPDNAAKQGRLYIAASSTYPEAEANKVAPFGSKAGDLFQGARGIFISGMAAADAQNFTLLADDETVVNPPNTQTISVGNMEAGYNVFVARRPEVTASLTYNDNDGAGDSEITRGSGDFIDEGFRVGMTVDISDTTSNNGSNVGRVKTVAALTLTLEGIVLTDEGPVSSTVEGSGVNRDEYSSHATNNTSGGSTFEITDGPIGTDRPSAGFIHVVHKDGTETSKGYYEYRYPYSSFTGSIFTLDGVTLDQTFDADTRCYVTYVDETSTAGATESKNYIHSTGFPVIVVARKVGFDDFIQAGQVTATGFSTNITKAVDPIVE